MISIVAALTVLAADPAPLTTISVTGEVKFEGKLLILCSPANPRSKPSQANPPGWQFRGGTAGREKSGAALKLNFHDGEKKVAGPQDAKASVSIEYSPKDGAPWASYFAVPGQVKVVLSKDFKTATVEGGFSSATSDDPVVQVKASVVCQ